jgi:hypothetical protein
VDLAKVNLSLTFDELEPAAAEELFEAHAGLGKKVVLCEEVAEVTLVHGPYLLDAPLLLNGVDTDDFDVETVLLLDHVVVLL